MKKIVCLILLLGSFATLSAQTFTAEMKRAGMMWYFADYQNADQARKIKVVGDINGDDIRVLRQLAGGKYGKELDEPDRGCLEELDLSEARIVAGGGAYWFGGLFPESHISRIMPERAMTYTEDDVVGGKMFEGCVRLKRLVLPLECNAVNSYFSNTPLNYVQLPQKVGEVHLSIFNEIIQNKQLQTVACPSPEPPVKKIVLFHIRHETAFTWASRAEPPPHRTPKEDCRSGIHLHCGRRDWTRSRHP